MSLSPGAFITYAVAAHEAVGSESTTLEPEHFFLGLLKIEDILRHDAFPEDFEAEKRTLAEREIASMVQFWKSQGLSCKQLRRRLRMLVRKYQSEKGEFSGHRSQRGRDMFDQAEEISDKRGDGMLTSFDILAACLSVESQALSALYEEYEIDPQKLQVALEKTLAEIPPGKPDAAGEEGEPEVPALPGEHPLAKYGRDLTAHAKAGKMGPIIGRNEEIKALARILTQRSRNNPLLLGDPGVGKTAVVEGLAIYTTSEDAIPPFDEMHIVEISMTALVAGTKYRGDFEARLQKVLDAAAEDPNLVLFIDELHTMMGVGGGDGSMDAGDMLKPALARGDIRCIGATTTPEYRQYIEVDGALARRFQVVWVDEPSRDETIEILHGLRPRLETHHSLSIPDQVLEMAVTLSSRFITDSYQPDKAIMVLDEACARRRLQTLDGSAKPEQAGTLEVEDIGEVISRRTNVPLEVVLTHDEERLLQLESELSQRVVGQEQAITAVGKSIRISRAGLRAPGKPVVLLFAGPTGTGKTELAKALSNFLFLDPKRLITLDMSEYQERHSIAKIIGSPPGYVGFGEEPHLIREIRQHPYSVVLLDEIEKAHHAIWTVFLQVFDEGRLTDARGRQINCGEAIFIMTSNLGVQVKAKPVIGFKVRDESEGVKKQIAAQAEQIREVIAETLPPELLNRIQEVVIFKPLSKEAIYIIIDIFRKGTNRRLEERQITIELEDSARDLLAEVGHSLTYGARFLSRAFEDLISEPLSNEILAGNINPGDTARFSAEKDEMVLDIDGGLGEKTIRYPSGMIDIPGQ
jgi:ATP-dependent Clp protease ATP-binding subunit ClpC